MAALHEGPGAHATSSPRTRGSSAFVVVHGDAVHLTEEAFGDATQSLRLPVGECAQRHAVRWRDVGPRATRMGASCVGGTGFQCTLSDQTIGLVRNARVDGVCDHARKAAQEMESCLEDPTHRGVESLLARSMERNPRLVDFALTERLKSLDSRFRGNDDSEVFDLCAGTHTEGHHSHESGNPVSFAVGVGAAGNPPLVPGF